MNNGAKRTKLCARWLSCSSHTTLQFLPGNPHQRCLVWQGSAISSSIVGPTFGQALVDGNCPLPLVFGEMTVLSGTAWVAKTKYATPAQAGSPLQATEVASHPLVPSFCVQLSPLYRLHSRQFFGYANSETSPTNPMGKSPVIYPPLSRCCE